MDPAASGRAPRKPVQYTTQTIEPILRQQQQQQQQQRQGQGQQGQDEELQAQRQNDEEPPRQLRDDWPSGVLHRQVKRIWRISVFMLFLMLLATAVHIVQFLVPPANSNGTRQSLFLGQAVGASLAPPQAPPIKSNSDTEPKLVGSNGDYKDLYAADIPLGRGFVQQTDQNGSETVYAVSAMHQLRCLYLIQTSFATALQDPTQLDPTHRRNTGHCIELLRQAVRCHADPTLDPAYPLATDSGTYTFTTLGWSSNHVCRDYDRLYAWAQDNRADDSTGLAVDYGFGAGGMSSGIW